MPPCARRTLMPGMPHLYFLLQFAVTTACY